jgi:WD40 repeat protein
MVTASGDGTARVWGAEGGKELLVIKAGYFNDSLALSADGKRLAIGSGNPKLTVWDAETGKEVYTLDAGCSTHNVAFSPDGSLVAVCSQGVNDITLWDGKTGEKKGAIVAGFDREKKIIVAGNVTSNLTFSPDGKWLITGTGDPIDDAKPGGVTVWDVAGKKKHAALKGHPGRVRAVEFLPGGKKLASASADGTVMVWEFEKVVKGRGDYHPHRSQPDGASLAASGSSAGCR